MLSGGHWVLQATKCDSRLRAVGRSCSSLPVEFAIILPPLRGLILDQSAVASVFLISLPLFEAKPAVCAGVWLGTWGLNLIKLKSGYVLFLKNAHFRWFSLHCQNEADYWVHFCPAWHTLWQVAENTHLHTFYDSNTRGHQSADPAVKRSNRLCREVKHNFCTVPFPQICSLGLGILLLQTLFLNSLLKLLVVNLFPQQMQLSKLEYWGEKERKKLSCFSGIFCS